MPPAIVKNRSEAERLASGATRPTAIDRTKRGGDSMASLSYDEAAHLLRRMGFGGPPEEIDALTAKGREGAVDYLIAYQQVNNQLMENQLARGFDFSDPANFSRSNLSDMQRWWFTRMIY